MKSDLTKRRNSYFWTTIIKLFLDDVIFNIATHRRILWVQFWRMETSELSRIAVNANSLASKNGRPRRAKLKVRA